jgi:oligoendopeptidase F
VLALYQQYLVEGDAFKPRYLKILASGGSQAPASVLAEAGIDIFSADFWQGGFDVIDQMVSRLEGIPTAS